MSRQPQLSLTSDGTWQGTSLRLDGTPLAGVTGVELHPIRVGHQMSMTVTTYIDRLALNGEVSYIYLFDPKPSDTTRLAPEPGSVWSHRNGNVYEVLFLTNVTDSYDVHYPLTVVYKGANGKTWSRVAADWHRSMTRLK